MASGSDADNEDETEEENDDDSERGDENSEEDDDLDAKIEFVINRLSNAGFRYGRGRVSKINEQIRKGKIT
uniref:Uncharacterized protein n=1 Tax=Panagrolaimus sp. ES5 TaxID=591445 RepID=A0AC34F1H8_9BILA